VLFFFSMHGYYDPGSELGYLIAADGLYRDDYYKTWLDYNSLRPYFAKCKAKHMLIALDACYSGSFGNIERAPDRPAYDEGQDCQTQIDASFQFRVRQYICSGNKDSKTPGKSLFAAKLLEALRQNETNGILHFDDLTYTLGKVRNPEPVHGSFTGHTPGGEFIFIRKNACAQQPRPRRRHRAPMPSTSAPTPGAARPTAVRPNCPKATIPPATSPSGKPPNNKIQRPHTAITCASFRRASSRSRLIKPCGRSKRPPHAAATTPPGKSLPKRTPRKTTKSISPTTLMACTAVKRTPK
jgi:hypothetical protein